MAKKRATKKDPVKKRTRNQIAAALRKQFGQDIVANFKESRAIDWAPTGLDSVDEAFGGGLPRGRQLEVYGPECLAESSFVRYEVRKADGTRQNHKGGTVKRLHERFHRMKVEGKGRYLRPETGESVYFAPSVNDAGRVIQNRVVDVFKSGKKNCFRVTVAGGYSIIATSEHRFFTGERYRRLRDLSIGDIVCIHNSTPFSVEPRTYRNDRKFLFVKAHPVAGTKIIEGRYEYRRLARARAVVEASMNSLPLDEYVSRLNDGVLKGLKFLTRDQHVHHIDENIVNDTLSNLEVVDSSTHGKLHAEERHNNLRFMAIEDAIVSVEPVGKMETYDIEMQAPFNNFVADNFVVHNSSGKSTFAFRCCAAAQARGEIVGYVDAENAIEPDWAGTIGWDVADEENTLLVYPNSAEEALDSVFEMAKNDIDLIVVDSVPALVPQSELDEESIGKQTMALQARLMSKACRDLNSILTHRKTTIIWINQIRNKVGLVFGNPETTPGGNALKFYASIRAEVRRKAKKIVNKKLVGFETRIETKKNKVAPPFREAFFFIDFAKGTRSIRKRKKK